MWKMLTWDQWTTKASRVDIPASRVSYTLTLLPLLNHYRIKNSLDRTEPSARLYSDKTLFKKQKQKNRHGLRETVQPIKCLLSKREDLSLAAITGGSCAYNSSTGGWGNRDREIPSTHRPPSLVKTVTSKFSKRSCLKNRAGGGSVVQ